VGQPAGLVVGDDLAGLRDVLFDGVDLIGPVASGFIGVGNASRVLALGLGQMIEKDVEVLLGSEAGHRVRIAVGHRLEGGRRRGGFLQFLLVFQAIDGPGYLLEALFFDGSAVHPAFAVVAVFDALQGGPNLLQ
jgi:hypothetical protein